MERGGEFMMVLNIDEESGAVGLADEDRLHCLSLSDSFDTVTRLFWVEFYPGRQEGPLGQ